MITFTIQIFYAETEEKAKNLAVEECTEIGYKEVKVLKARKELGNNWLVTLQADKETVFTYE